MARKSRFVTLIEKRMDSRGLDLALLKNRVDEATTLLAELIIKQTAIEEGIKEDMELLEAAKPEPRTMKKDKDAT